MKRMYEISLIFWVILMTSLACSMPLQPLPTPMPSATAQVVSNPPTASPETAAPAANIPLITVTNPPVPTLAQATAVPTSAPVANSSGLPCNLAAFGGDITYPDDTVVPAGANFEKKWKLVNAGTCTWTSNYKVLYVSGDALSGAGSTVLTNGVVHPGDAVDISVNLKAPMDPGTYRGNYKLQAPDGTTFGIDAAGNVFYVRIIVEGQNAPQNGGGGDDEESSIPVLIRNMKLTSPYMKGNDVSMLQQRLLARGYSVVGSADGTFGPKTDKGVRQFQADQGLTVDGVVGPNTWKALWE